MTTQWTALTLTHGCPGTTCKHTRTRKAPPYSSDTNLRRIGSLPKNDASLLPLNVEKEETFRGHLLMTFIATVLLQMLQNEIRQSPFSLDRILARMQTQKAKVYENVVIPSEPVKEHNEIYKLLRIKPRKEHTVPADRMP